MQKVNIKLIAFNSSQKTTHGKTKKIRENPGV